VGDIVSPCGRSPRRGVGLRRGVSVVFVVAAVAAYDWTLRRWMLDWGTTPEERKAALPGDEIVEDVMTHHTRALTIDAPPEAVWPWLVQMGDHRAGWYSYDWIETYLFPGTVHRIDGRHSATRIHPELQDVKVGDQIDTGSLGDRRIGAPVTTCEANRALVIGTWAFVLEPLSGGRTRLLNRERDSGWLKVAVPNRAGPLRAVAALVDYLIGEPLHFAMVRKMMLGLKTRAERG
jgi:hypothetical protein